MILQTCWEKFNTAKYVHGICKGANYKNSSLLPAGRIESQSCTLRCYASSEKSSISTNTSNKLEHTKHFLPDGVKCDHANSLNYCVRGRCEVYTHNE